MRKLMEKLELDLDPQTEQLLAALHAGTVSGSPTETLSRLEASQVSCRILLS